VRDVYHHNEKTIDSLPEPQRFDALCEEHLRHQTENICRTHIVQNAWSRGQPLSVNGFIYRLSDGKLIRLVEPITSVADARVSSKFRVVKH
jgi:carbonic anhydrase